MAVFARKVELLVAEKSEVYTIKGKKTLCISLDDIFAIMHELDVRKHLKRDLNKHLRSSDQVLSCKIDFVHLGVGNIFNAVVIAVLINLLHIGSFGVDEWNALQSRVIQLRCGSCIDNVTDNAADQSVSGVVSPVSEVKSITDVTVCASIATVDSTVSSESAASSSSLVAVNVVNKHPLPCINATAPENSLQIVPVSSEFAIVPVTDMWSGSRYTRFKESEYIEMDKPQLVDLCVQRDNIISEQKSDIRTKDKQLSRTMTSKDKITKKHDELKIEFNKASDLAIERKNKRHKGPGSSHLTLRGQANVAVRMAILNCAARRFGIGALDDLSKDTVVKCEIFGGYCLLKIYANFHEQMKHNLRRGPQDGSEYSVVFISYSSDATTTNIHLGSALFNAYCKTFYTLTPSKVSSITNANFDSVIRSHAGWLPTLKVKDKSAYGTAGLLFKQLHSVLTPLPIPRPPEIIDESEDQTVYVYACTSDGGSDQIKYKRFMVAWSALDPLMFFFCIACLMHVLQLLVKNGMTVIDKWVFNETFFFI